MILVAHLDVASALIMFGLMQVLTGVTYGIPLAALSFVIVVVLLGNRRFPPALFVIALGVAYALVFKIHFADLAHGFGFSLPQRHVPSRSDIWTGFLLLALPQIPLSLGNSILA